MKKKTRLEIDQGIFRYYFYFGIISDFNSLL